MANDKYRLLDTDGDEIPHAYEVLMTTKDVAAVMRVDPRTVTNWARQGKLRCTRTAGGHRRYYADSVRAAYENRWEEAASGPKDGPKEVVYVV